MEILDHRGSEGSFGSETVLWVLRSSRASWFSRSSNAFNVGSFEMFDRLPPERNMLAHGSSFQLRGCCLWDNQVQGQSPYSPNI